MVQEVMDYGIRTGLGECEVERGEVRERWGGMILRRCLKGKILHRCKCKVIDG
jgi:hypothetical protein